MAEYLCGSQEAFVERMNTRAKELGMNDTTFKNCYYQNRDALKLIEHLYFAIKNIYSN